MALRYRRSDIRLYVGGRAVHGLTADARTLRSIGWQSAFPNERRTAIGDASERYTYLRSKSGTLTVEGFFDHAHGLQPMLNDVLPGAGGDALPVTVSTTGGAARSRSIVAESAQWNGRTIPGPAGALELVNAEAQLSNFADALCIGEGRQVGSGAVNVGDLDLQSAPLPILLGSPRVQLISGSTELLFNMNTALFHRHLHIGSDIVFEPNLTGTYRVLTEVPNAGGSSAITAGLPGGGVINAPSGIRDALTSIRVVDTFAGDRVGLVHLQGVVPRDAQTLEVAMQGTAPGTNAWADVGTPQSVGIAAEGADWVRSFRFPLDAGIRSVARVRVQLRFQLAGGALGAAPNYEINWGRFDWQPDVAHQ